MYKHIKLVISGMEWEVFFPLCMYLVFKPRKKYVNAETLSYLYILSKSVDQICFWRFWYHVTDRSLSRKCESCDVLRFLSISNDCWFARKPVFVGKQQSCQNKLYRNINEQIVTKARKCIYTHKLKLSFPWCLLRYLFPESQKSGVSKNLVMCWQNNNKLSSSSTLNYMPCIQTL